MAYLCLTTLSFHNKGQQRAYSNQNEDDGSRSDKSKLPAVGKRNDDGGNHGGVVLYKYTQLLRDTKLQGIAGCRNCRGCVSRRHGIQDVDALGKECL